MEAMTRAKKYSLGNVECPRELMRGQPHFKMPFTASIFCGYIFVTVLCSCSEAAGESIIVYPQVFESRKDKSEKILLIEGYTLNLKKASVLAETLLLLDVTDYGTVERYVQGAHYERHLYEDADKQASLILKPAGQDGYHITGVVNFTHRIAPFMSWERTSPQGMPHRVSEIDALSGTHEVVERAESDLDEDPLPQEIENNGSLPEYTLELHFITGVNHTGFFGNQSEDRIAYAMLFMNAVSLRLQQLEPPVRIGLTAIEALQTTPPYVKLSEEGYMIVYDTVDHLSQHVREDRLKNMSDAVFMASRLPLAKYTKEKKYIKSILGLAGYVGTVCRNRNVAIGLDVPDSFSGVQTAAHELAHLLGAPHDGEGGAKKCGTSSPYLMSHSRRGKTLCAFSNCTKEVIAEHLRKPESSCMWNRTVCHVIDLPNKAVKLPGDVMDPDTFCTKMYPMPNFLSSTYIKDDSEISECLFRCLVEYARPRGYWKNRTTFAVDGTPCSKAEPRKVCKNMVCVDP